MKSSGRIRAVEMTVPSSFEERAKALLAALDHAVVTDDSPVNVRGASTRTLEGEPIGDTVVMIVVRESIHVFSLAEARQVAEGIERAIGDGCGDCKVCNFSQWLIRSINETVTEMTVN